MVRLQAKARSPDDDHHPSAHPFDKYRYADGFYRHQVALGLLQSCGFGGLGDGKKLSREALIATLRANKDVLTNATFAQRCAVLFKCEVPVLDVDVTPLKKILKFIETICKYMYGAHVGRMSSSNKHCADSNAPEKETYVLHCCPLFTLDGQVPAKE